MALNKIILIGNLGKDPEIKRLDNDRMVAKFSLATNETYKNKLGEKVTQTEWHNIVVWSPLAEVVEKWLTKGKQVYIEGKLTHRSYEDKDNVTKYISEIVCKNLIMLGSGTQTNTNMQDTQQISSTTEGANNLIKEEGMSTIDELPF